MGYPGTSGSGYMTTSVPIQCVRRISKPSSAKDRGLARHSWVTDTQRAVAQAQPRRGGPAENGFVFCCFNLVENYPPLFDTP